MKSTSMYGLPIAAICFVLFTGSMLAQSEPWVTAYYAGWSQGWNDNGVLPSADIDYDGVTHIIHFALVPRSDGSLDDQSNSVHQSNAKALVEKAHAAGKKVLICVGGWNTNVEFRNATHLLTRSVFISNLVKLMQDRNYDGIDVDWEPLEYSDLLQYTAFIAELRTRLDQISPRPLLAAATAWQPPIFALVSNFFDQINLMTYDLSGAWPGWVSWHNSALFDGGYRFASTERLVPSADNMVDEFALAGIPKNKLGIGVDFYGYIWSGGSGTSTGGVTEPRQTWNSPPQVQANIPYYSLMQGYYAPQYYRWDSAAQSSYISFDKPGSSDDKFITYDNEMTCRMKLEYARSKGIGGVIIWELGGGMLPNRFSNRDRLLKTVKKALAYDTAAPAPPSSTIFPVNFARGVPLKQTLQWSASNDASWYRIQIAHDSLFTSPITDQPWIIEPSFSIDNLPPDTTYYWRIQPSNAFASGEWSRPSFFGTAVDSLAPARWQYVSNTGENATVLIPSTLVPQIGKRFLQSGDLVGAFFNHEGAFKCAGYSRWEEGKNISITVWGDNQQTAVKEGFTAGDTLHFKFWERKFNSENIAVPEYASGGQTYATDGIYVLQSLNAPADNKQLIPLNKGWNMISSYIRPNDPSMESISASLASNVVLIKDNKGNVYLPDSNVNTIGEWESGQGYQIFMSSPDTLAMTGEEIAPESTAIELNEGWNMSAYFRNSSMSPDAALQNVQENLVLVKNNSGGIYWPEFEINTLGTMDPGQGYKISVRQHDLLLYPPNDQPAAPKTMISAQTSLPEWKMSSRNYYPDISGTGNNAIMLLQSPEFSDGDEVGVWSSTKVLVGTGTVQSGKCAVVIWGKDPLVENSSGAEEGEALSLTLWQPSLQREAELELTSLKNVFTGESESGPPRYREEGVMIASTKPVPVTHYLEQNFPNPFNHSTVIHFGLSVQTKTNLGVYNSLGQQITQLASGIYPAGQYSVRFGNAALASGMYLCRLQAGRSVLVRKMLLVK